MSWGKYRKAQNFFHFNRKIKYRNRKDGNESVGTISYKIKFIDSARFVATSLSHLGDNITELIHKIKCKNGDCFLQYESAKDNLIKYKFKQNIQTKLKSN